MKSYLFYFSHVVSIVLLIERVDQVGELNSDTTAKIHWHYVVHCCCCCCSYCLLFDVRVVDCWMVLLIVLRLLLVVVGGE